jgi:putative transcriptional regulator
MSKILDAVHEAARDLHKARLVDEVTMREFDALCVPPVKPYSARDIRRIRQRARVSQAVFAAVMNVGKSTVQQWEQGVKKPQGASLKLLSIVDRKGIDALM